MKNQLSNIALVLILIIGLSLVLYPSFANWWNELHSSSVISIYESLMSEMTDEDYAHLFEDAVQYNEKLRKVKFPLMNHGQLENYYTLLNVDNNGVMGYITIPKIHVELPVYHGTSDGVLQIAAGHLQGTSLPTGGEGFHIALSAHRGLPSARLFTDLDELDVGDIFMLHILDKTLTYEVDQIKIVMPYETDDLLPQDGRDLCTLVTCTPYGINSHRMLVRGTRIENLEEATTVRIAADAIQVEPLVVAPILAAPLLTVFFLAVMLPGSKKKKDVEMFPVNP